MFPVIIRPDQTSKTAYIGLDIDFLLEDSFIFQEILGYPSVVIITVESVHAQETPCM